MFFNLFKKQKPRARTARLNTFSLPSLSATDLLRNEMNKLLGEIDVNNNARAIMLQARHLQLSNPLIAGYFNIMLSEIIGKGFALDLTSDDKRLNIEIERAFKAWRLQGEPDFFDIEKQALLHFLRDGECFIFVNETPGGLKLSIIDPLNIEHDNTDEGASIFHGIEIKNDEVIAYHVLQKDGSTLRIAADKILHIKESVNANQKRGLSVLTSAILPAHLNDSFKSSELKRARLQGEITGFFIKDGTSFEIEPLSSDDESATQETVRRDEVAVGKINYIDENLKPHFIESHNPTNIEFFVKDNKREIARALGVSYSTLTGDLREVNYSSIRHGSIEQRRYFRQLQDFLSRKLHNKIFKAWVLNEIKRHNIKPAAFDKIIQNYTFKPQGWEYIDPYKENNANKVALATGQKTLSEILRERGREPDTHFDELKREKEIRDLLKDNN